MSSLFSSPSKQAQAAASAQQGISQQAIQEMEQYVQQQQQQERGAIAGLGPNPYFTAASEMTPGAYAVNPQDAVTFGATGPGTSIGTTNLFGPPPGVEPPPSTRLPNEPRQIAQGLEGGGSPAGGAGGGGGTKPPPGGARRVPGGGGSPLDPYRAGLE